MFCIVHHVIDLFFACKSNNSLGSLFSSPDGSGLVLNFIGGKHSVQESKKFYGTENIIFSSKSHILYDFFITVPYTIRHTIFFSTK
jgi:hypothetical protein